MYTADVDSKPLLRNLRSICIKTRRVSATMFRRVITIIVTKSESAKIVNIQRSCIGRIETYLFISVISENGNNEFGGIYCYNRFDFLKRA